MAIGHLIVGQEHRFSEPPLRWRIIGCRAFCRWHNDQAGSRGGIEAGRLKGAQHGFAISDAVIAFASTIRLR